MTTRELTLEGLLRWAGAPGRQVWCQDTDSWYANDDEAFHSGETPEELAGALGIEVPAEPPTGEVLERHSIAASGFGHSHGLSDHATDAGMSSMGPKKAIELRITANGWNWEQVIAALEERLERVRELREQSGGCSASGYGASHTCDVELRDVTVEQFADESIAWLEAQQAERRRG